VAPSENYDNPVKVRIGLFVLTAALLAGVAAACKRLCRTADTAPDAQEHAHATPTATSRSWPTWLRPLPRRGVSICEWLQRRSRYVVLCPAKVFVPPISKRLPLAIRSFPRGLQSRGRRFPHLYEIDFGYGAPSDEVGSARNPHPAQRYTPARFFHFVIGGGEFKLDQVAIEQRLPGVGLTARRLGTVTLGGRRGTLFVGRSYPVGGYLGGHLTFVWRSNRARYFASLHTWVPRRQTLRTLDVLVRSFEPAARLGSRSNTTRLGRRCDRPVAEAASRPV